MLADASLADVFILFVARDPACEKDGQTIRTYRRIDSISSKITEVDDYGVSW